MDDLNYTELGADTLAAIIQDKKQSKALRQITKRSACTLSEAYAFIIESNNYKRDKEIIIKLKNRGFSNQAIINVIAALNIEDEKQT